MRRLIILSVFLAACDTHNSLTAPASAYCDTITYVTVTDTSVQVSGQWQFTIIRIHSVPKISWYRCKDGPGGHYASP